MKVRSLYLSVRTYYYRQQEGRGNEKVLRTVQFENP